MVEKGPPTPTPTPVGANIPAQTKARATPKPTISKTNIQICRFLYGYSAKIDYKTIRRIET